MTSLTVALLMRFQKPLTIASQRFDVLALESVSCSNSVLCIP